MAACSVDDKTGKLSAAGCRSRADGELGGVTNPYASSTYHDCFIPEPLICPSLGPLSSFPAVEPTITPPVGSIGDEVFV